jgi:hypothetical protein
MALQLCIAIGSSAPPNYASPVVAGVRLAEAILIRQDFCEDQPRAAMLRVWSIPPPAHVHKEIDESRLYL